MPVDAPQSLEEQDPVIDQCIAVIDTFKETCLELLDCTQDAPDYMEKRLASGNALNDLITTIDQYERKFGNRMIPYSTRLLARQYLIILDNESEEEKKSLLSQIEDFRTTVEWDLQG